ncbi:MAG: nitroreductase family protein [Nocardioides sp.]|uniref:nitroreductase family protein n=1 Tax=Nocardioides sp. TaxID=35761 RepID=UPI0039E45330
MRRWWKRESEPTERSPWEELLAEMRLDAERYFAHMIRSGGDERFSEMTGMQLDAATTRHYHRIEKGFSMPGTKRPFGTRAIPVLTRALANPALDEEFIYPAEARSVLTALERWNAEQVREDVVAPLGESLPTNPLDPETLATFITSRHSIRDFDARPVDRAMVEEAVRLASHAPSVCNRQGFRAYWFDDPADIARVLSEHQGSRGFREKVPGLFVVTFDIRAFEDVRERNQGWIDGGLFAMTLMLALHGLGLGTVPLNWSRRNGVTNRLRTLAAIPEHENVVMLIAAGHPAPGYRVARSTRRPVSEILRIGMPR